eukprot:TRINITY_DN38710_c0_g1_i1.p1 TRINITY_DN38710_c0_g1~~TRINITY_DN38710_c0_g1_i1.p1  ORF type:complete len:184 (+),score=45.14 TRINITY_DN38710_c0_g1_i1:60-611(+)
MTKLRKQRRRKKYDYARNRKRVRKQQEKTTKFNVKVDCKTIKDAWDNRISIKENMSSMGIVLNASDIMPADNAKQKLIKQMKKMNNKPVTEAVEAKVTKPDVLDQLTAEANVPAKQNFRFSTTQVKLITYMMDKHGSDYKAMSRDPRNHYQETPAKLKGMITKFISIPEHYAPYCKERGLLTT